jgi:DNA-binding NtrC family response regulator
MMQDRKSHFIIVIDDEKHVRESLSQYLSDIGKYRAKSFSSGEDALIWLEKNECDLCIVDIKMPGLSGLDTILEIRKLKPSMRFIIFTGSRLQNFEELSKKVGVIQDFIIVKPLSNMDIFLDKVDKIFRQ